MALQQVRVPQRWRPKGSFSDRRWWFGVRLNKVMDVILDELDHFEDGPWYGDRSLAVADGLARAEFDNEALRAVGEAIGDVDNHNRTTAYASAAHRTVAALHAIVDCAATVNYPDDAPLLSDVSGSEGMETASGAPKAYEIIEAVAIEIAEDCFASLESADYRNQAIGMYQRDADVGDAQGTVWLPFMSGQTGVTQATLSKPLSAKDWTLEAAQDAAQIAAHPEDVADEEVIAAAKGGIAKELIVRVVAAVILGQGQLPVQQRKEAFFEDALIVCSDLAEDGEVLTHGDEEEIQDYERECNDAIKRLLETGRSLAAAITAYAALSEALEGVSIAPDSQEGVR